PARVLLSAEVDEPVDTATNQATRFFAQGASGIEADDAAARGGRGDDRAVQAARGGAGESNSRDGRLLQRRHDLEARWDLSVVAEEAGDGGFPYSGRGGEHAVGDVARRRLRHDHDHAGPMTMRPSSRPRSLSATSSARETPSLKRKTWRPADSAW